MTRRPHQCNNIRILSSRFCFTMILRKCFNVGYFDQFPFYLLPLVINSSGLSTRRHASSSIRKPIHEWLPFPNPSNYHGGRTLYKYGTEAYLVMALKRYKKSSPNSFALVKLRQPEIPTNRVDIYLRKKKRNRNRYNEFHPSRTQIYS